MFKFDVPIDASAAGAARALKVLAVSRGGETQARTVEIDARGRAVASFELAEKPQGLSVVVGPADVADEELVGLDAPALTLGARELARIEKIAPLKIPPFFLKQWLLRCRTFVIHGRVLCPDGQPVPGAVVDAYDIDMWWWWSSRQHVAKATTAADGTFTMEFKWCCGYRPIWWWKRRHWQLEPWLASKIIPALRLDPRLRKIPAPQPEPDLAVFAGLLSGAGDSSARREIDPAQLAPLRERLRALLPEIPELDKLRLWPWFPWLPWGDCAPDLVFKVTQSCGGASNVIVDEGVSEVRWNVPLDSTVTLVAGEGACCLSPSEDCTVSHVCQSTLDHIGGNAGAPVGPAGYHDPGGQDRPYGGRIYVYGEVDSGDYYEIEHSRLADDPALASSWHPMPAASLGTIHRRYFQAPTTFQNEPFVVQTIDGHLVYETRGHYESAHGSRLWVGAEDHLVIPWNTEGLFSDDTYRLRVVSYDLGADGKLVNRRVRPVCPGAASDHVVLTIDNRLVLSGPTDAHGKACGEGTLHTCTDEPDTEIIEVRFAGQTVNPCDILQAKDGGQLEIRFRAYDSAGHLGGFSLSAEHGDSAAVDLLPLGALVDAAGNPAHDNYAASVITRPIWRGGELKLTIPDIRGSAAFPRSCAYQIRLQAQKRTIVGCAYAHENKSTTSFTVLFS